MDITYIAGEELKAHDWVTIHPSDGKVYKATSLKNRITQTFIDVKEGDELCLSDDVWKENGVIDCVSFPIILEGDDTWVSKSILTEEERKDVLISQSKFMDEIARGVYNKPFTNEKDYK